MNAYTFDTPSPTCPICHRTGAIKPHKLLRGLLTCQYCRERLVVSWSGHYVRDPFTLKHITDGQRLRQQSHPLARIWRDFKSPHPALMIALSSIMVLGLLAIFQGIPTASSRFESLSSPTEQVEQD